MFRFTRKVDYSLLLLSELSLTEGQSARTLADRYNLSHSLVANLLKLLVRTGFVQSIRGKAGGYVLARAQETISIADVIGHVDGAYSLVDCLDTTGEKSCDCHDKPVSAAATQPAAAQHQPLVQLQDNVAELLDDDSCSMVEVCPCRPLFSLMHDEIMGIMRKYTIADIHRNGCSAKSGHSRRMTAQPVPLPAVQ